MRTSSANCRGTWTRGEAKAVMMTRQPVPDLRAFPMTRARALEVFQRLTTLDPAAIGAEELTPEESPFLRFEAEAQERFDAWRAALEQTLRAVGRHRHAWSPDDVQDCEISRTVERLDL